MTTPDNSKADAQPEVKKKISIKVFGVGGGGCNAVSFAAQGDLRDGQFWAINTDSQALELCTLENKVVLGAKRTRGLGCGGDPELGRAVAIDDEEKLRRLCVGADLIVILAGMGGGTGTGASPVLARIAKESGALVLSIVTLPFEFEGGRRQRQAQLGLQLLKSEADAVICLPNERLQKLIGEKTSVLDAFKTSNSLLAQGIRGIWRLLTCVGLINVDFADLCSVTRGKHAESAFAYAEAAGEQKVDQVLEHLFCHPLLDGGQVLNESDAVLVSIVGGPDLTMAEVNRLMAQLNRNCENAHLILGAGIDPEYTGRLSVTLIASRQDRSARQEHEPAVAAPQPVSKPVEPLVNEEVAVSSQFLDTQSTLHPPSRFVPPPPAITQEEKTRVLNRGHSRKKSSRFQKELPLEVVSKGRFDKSEPTIRDGEDLDVPTYIRLGTKLN